MKSFREWLLTYNRDNRIGDLAKDVRSDPPAGAWDYLDLVTHMKIRHACKEAFDALKAAIRAYERYSAKA